MIPSQTSDSLTWQSLAQNLQRMTTIALMESLPSDGGIVFGYGVEQLDAARLSGHLFAPKEEENA